MGGPGSGGYKNAPGDTETHSAWDILPQDSDSGQVSRPVLKKRAFTWLNASTSFDGRFVLIGFGRNWLKCDANTVRVRWRSTHRDSERTYYNVNSISTR